MPKAREVKVPLKTLGLIIFIAGLFIGATFLSITALPLDLRLQVTGTKLPILFAQYKKSSPTHTHDFSTSELQPLLQANELFLRIRGTTDGINAGELVWGATVTGESSNRPYVAKMFYGAQEIILSEGVTFDPNILDNVLAILRLAADCKDKLPPFNIICLNEVTQNMLLITADPGSFVILVPLKPYLGLLQRAAVEGIAVRFELYINIPWDAWLASGGSTPANCFFGTCYDIKWTPTWQIEVSFVYEAGSDNSLPDDGQQILSDKLNYQTQPFFPPSLSTGTVWRPDGTTYTVALDQNNRYTLDPNGDSICHYRTGVPFVVTKFTKTYTMTFTDKQAFFVWLYIYGYAQTREKYGEDCPYWDWQVAADRGFSITMTNVASGKTGTYNFRLTSLEDLAPQDTLAADIAGSDIYLPASFNDIAKGEVRVTLTGETGDWWRVGFTLMRRTFPPLAGIPFFSQFIAFFDTLTRYFTASATLPFVLLTGAIVLGASYMVWRWFFSSPSGGRKK